MSQEKEDLSSEVLDESQGSILLGLISQLRKGSDLHKVTLPTFVLEPRSMLERITDFVSHPDLILETAKKEDPVIRFIDVVRYFISIWHVRPKGVKKPYNPVLGELFRCKWEFENNTEGYYVAEQVSHHPPISCYVFASPENNIIITGEVRPTSKFLGNSAATIMGGGSKIQFLNRPGEEYFVSTPNIYARGILFGTMFMELGDIVTIKCPKTNISCEIEFKVKGFFTGSYNAIAGKVKDDASGETLFNLSGKWSEVIYYQKTNWPNKEVLFDVSTSKIHKKIVAPEEEMNEFESRLLWTKVTKAMFAKDLDTATEEKSKIEDQQRRVVKNRTGNGTKWENQFFELNNDEWKFKCPISDDLLLAKEEIKSFIFSKPRLPMYEKFWTS
ncbi:hypothetical protein HK099_007440 [Clydaea vesicula]|uniref:Oxysterol-binding protein n=1 Tax=Clydaea vesicula TaxID=447962 RepID=A0AAD5Y0L4_9FUNG|nr:hypothetical protein HK099_007440 [Clydaea vesicula]